jgi:hypothetical protein
VTVPRPAPRRSARCGNRFCRRQIVEWLGLTRRRRRGVGHDDLSACASGRDTGRRGKLRAIAEIVAAPLLERQSAGPRRHCRDAVEDDIRQGIAENFRSIRADVQIDVADVSAAGICYEHRVAHRAVAIARPRGETPRPRAYADRRLERRIAEAEDFELIACDIRQIEPVLARVIQRVGNFAATW